MRVQGLGAHEAIVPGFAESIFYTGRMKTSAPRSWNPRRFDVQAFAEAGASLSGDESLSLFERLMHECHADGDPAIAVKWLVRGETRADATGQPAVWMHLTAHLDLPVGCQRCLGPVMVPLKVDRWFRFVADEATAEAEDDDCEEDVLALEPKPDLLTLVEDELLMEMPLVPMHETCPGVLPVPPSTNAEGGGEVSRPNPFASLARLKKPMS